MISWFLENITVSSKEREEPLAFTRSLLTGGVGQFHSRGGFSSVIKVSRVVHSLQMAADSLQMGTCSIQLLTLHGHPVSSWAVWEIGRYVDKIEEGREELEQVHKWLILALIRYSLKAEVRSLFRVKWFFFFFLIFIFLLPCIWKPS